MKKNYLTRLIKINFILSLLFIAGCGSDNDPIEEETIDEETIEIEKNAIIEIVSDNNIDFGNVVIGTQLIKSFEIKNNGNADLIISNITIPDYFSLNTSSAVILTNNTLEIEITFNPTVINENEGELSIKSNATSGTNTITLQGNGISNIFDGDVILNSQQEVNDFGILGYIGITGKLGIGDINTTDISDLSILSGLQSTDGLQIRFNPLLSSLQGIENLIIENSISLFRNDLIENYNELTGIPNELELLQITDHLALNNLSAFSNITSIGTLIIQENVLITNIDSFSNLTTINGDIRINDNTLLTNLDGLVSLNYVGNNISISYNENLSSYCGITNLKQSAGVQGIFFEIVFNKFNPTQSILTECQRNVPDGIYSGNLTIRTQGALDYFITRRNHTIIDGNLSIVNIENVENLTTSLNQVTGSLYISNLESTSLSGLENLNSIGSIQITECSNLTDFCALNNVINNGNFSNLSITNNFYNPTVSDFNAGNCSQ